jgi:hypothetical protein
LHRDCHRPPGRTRSGFSNLFLAVGTLAGLAGSDPPMRRGAVIQGAPPLLFLLLAAFR